MVSAFEFLDLTSDVRRNMVDEASADIGEGVLYLSKFFNAEGGKRYPRVLMEALSEHHERWLAEQLVGCFMLERNGRQVPRDAAVRFAGSEFNRFYIRGVCRAAVADGVSVVVYRARPSANPRQRSEELIGARFDPADVLHDLRFRIGVEPRLGLPLVHSGLSVRLEESA